MVPPHFCICELRDISVPSSNTSASDEDRGCVEGVLVKIEREEKVERQATEVCLADDYMGGGLKCGGKREEEKKDRAVQKEWSSEPGDLAGLLKDFLNLRAGRGLLPDPVGEDAAKGELEPLEWTVVVYPHNQCGGRRVIRSSPSLLQQPHEGDWERHPCCGTICAVRTTPLRPMTDYEWFGPAPM